MGKSKSHRPAPPPNPSPVKSAVVPQQRTEYSWKRLGLGVLAIIALGGIWWYAVRPQLLVRQARDILTSDPQTAAVLLEDAVASSLWGTRDAEVLWARALLRSGQSEEALGCFGLIKSPELAEASGLIDLADDAMIAEMSLLAVLTLEAIPTDSPQCGEALERLISIKQLYGDSAAAMKLATDWTQSQPARPAPWRILARIHEQRLEFPEALLDYREALTREADATSRSEIQRSQVRLLIVLGEREEARKVQAELSRTAIVPTTADQLLDAQLRRMEGDIDGAWSEVEKVLQAEAANLAALELRGTLAMDRHEYARAEADWEAILQQQPWNKAVHYKLAQTLAKLGREAESASHFAENRRLLKLSLRILELQGRSDLSVSETTELSRALEQTGLKTAADRLRPRSIP